VCGDEHVDAVRRIGGQTRNEPRLAGNGVEPLDCAELVDCLPEPLAILCE
jgi:hypothetical protein